MKAKFFLFAPLALAIAGGALAQGSTWTNKTGTIQHISLSGSSNFAFRIYLSNAGADQLGSCNGDFAYMNVSDDNYQVKAALLLSAYAQQKTVTVYYYPDSNGYCQLNDINN